MTKRSRSRRIISGDKVQLRHGKDRAGIVGYAPYSLDLCCVTWFGRKTHGICRKSDLMRVKTKAGKHD